MDLIYEVYPEKKEEAEKEKIEKEKRLKEVEERRARRHALDKPIEEEVNKTINLSAGFENQEVKPIIENTDSVISETEESEESASSHEDNKVIEDVKDDDTKQ